MRVYGLGVSEGLGLRGENSIGCHRFNRFVLRGGSEWDLGSRFGFEAFLSRLTSGRAWSAFWRASSSHSRAWRVGGLICRAGETLNPKP